MTAPDWTLVAAHAGVGPSVEFAALLGIAGVGSALVLALALAALVRRRSRPYLLVALALSTLLARTGVGVLSAAGSVGAETHHVLEHGLDVAMAALVVAAVYDARTARKTADAAARRDDSGGEGP
ncbi:hypothetical protein NGM10_17130 (plasmid) [Halorussus salilacus]|uniref:DUF7471 family protein n=1 Tax=Halorussus salilacus TaxID=2953750 RepID=UPI00209FF234|nr:hypothetical protein [Halorussus salilacus]USZ69819.1 hypothetical protein NGM10_17130 [Halorussus salilacus]